MRVYNEAADDFYVHHDYLLEAPPLCLEPFYYDPGSDNKQVIEEANKYGKEGSAK